MRFLERLFRRLSGGDAAERAELAGDLTSAIRLWTASGAVDEAARVMVLRGDSEPDPKLRLQHYTQATATATDGSPAQTSARVKRARLTVSLAEGSTLSAALRRDVVEAAHELEKAGEAAAAAAAYALAGDTEGQARALAQGGEVDRLEELLSRDQSRTSDAKRAEHAHVEIDTLIGAGQRHEALMLAERSPEDPLARSRAARLRGARIVGPVVRVVLHGRRIALVLGDEVIVGRTEGAITVASSALSRRHVQIGREGDGFVVADLGTRNGTQLRGLNLAHRLEVGDGVTLTLGGEVALVLAPSTDLPKALLVDVAGEQYVAPLGEARLGIGSWRLTAAADGWVELVTEGGPSAFVGELQLAPRITLLRGDVLSCERRGEAVLRVEE